MEKKGKRMKLKLNLNNVNDIKEFVNNIMDALNDKDYDYVTYYLDDTYLKYFFDNDKEKTKETLKNYLEDGVKYQITDISDAGDKYYVSIGYTKDEIFRTKYITLYDLENGVLPTNGTTISKNSKDCVKDGNINPNDDDTYYLCSEEELINL